MLASRPAPASNPAAVFQHQLEAVGVDLTLRRQTGGTWAEVAGTVRAIPDFTPGGIIRAQQAGLSVGLIGESSGAAWYIEPDTDMRVADTFQYAGALYRVAWVGPAGGSLDGSAAALRVAYATAQKAPGGAN